MWTEDKTKLSYRFCEFSCALEDPVCCLSSGEATTRAWIWYTRVTFSSIHSVDCQLRLFHLFLLGYELQARMEVQHCTVIERLIEVTEDENLPTWFNKMPQVDNAVVPAWREEALLLKLSIICLELTYKIIIGKAPYCETLVNKWSGKP